jgi:NADH oxidase (H2O2-forming)
LRRRISKRIVIIGNGVAGNTACSVIKRVSSPTKITLFSKDSFRYYSACVLPNYISGEIPRERVFLKPSFLTESIQLFLNEAVLGIDRERQEIISERRRVPFDLLIFATGSTPVMPSIKGVGIPGIFTLKTLRDSDRIVGSIPGKVVIVGSGPVAVEAAVALKKRGCSVSIIARRDWILRNFFDRNLSLQLIEVLRKNGIRVFLNEVVKEIIGNEWVEEVVTSRRKLEVSLVIMAVGMRPETQLAKEAGLGIWEEGGIIANDLMETTVKNIYACGDCAVTRDSISDSYESNMLWHNARNQGEIAGANSLGFKHRFPGTFNTKVLNLFGTFAVSMGKPSISFEGGSLEVVQKKGQKTFSRVLVRGGKIVGAQFIGDANGLGVLLSKIRKGEEWSKLLGMLKTRGYLLRYPLSYVIKDYLMVA